MGDLNVDGLAYAVISDNLKAVKFFVEEVGVATNILIQGESLIEFAKRHGYTEIEQLLKQYEN